MENDSGGFQAKSHNVELQIAQTVAGLKEKRWRTILVGFRQGTTLVDFTGISVVCFGRRMTMLGRPTNVVGGICGL